MIAISVGVVHDVGAIGVVDGCIGVVDDEVGSMRCDGVACVVLGG